MNSRLALLFLLSAVFIVVMGHADSPVLEGLYLKEEEDILVYNKAEVSGMQATALRNTSYKWPDAEVAVYFHTSYSPREVINITEAMLEIQNRTCVRFKRVEENHPNFVYIIKPSFVGIEDACLSMVGMTGKNSINRSQPLLLADYCLKRKKTILHELMHTLGFIHEHNRSDRDEYVDVKWNNIQYKDEHNFKKRVTDELILLETGYAYDSIMHYESSQVGQLFDKEGITRMGGGEGLSLIDAQRINKYYGCPEKAENYDDYEGEEEWNGSLLDTLVWEYRDCPDAFATPAEGGNCRWLLMKTRKDPNSSVHFFYCKKTPNERDEGCGKWKREQCQIGTVYSSAHGACRPAKTKPS